MARTAERELERRKARVLGFLRDKGAGARPIGASKEMLACGLGTTESRLRHDLKALRDGGMLEARARFLPDGGRQANEYRITPRGLRWLAAVEGGKAPGAEREGEREGRERGGCGSKRTA